MEDGIDFGAMQTMQTRFIPSSRRCSLAGPAPRPRVARSSVMQPQAQDKTRSMSIRRWNRLVVASSSEGSEKQEDVPTDRDAAASASSDEERMVSPVERARLAMAGEDVDKEGLTAAITDLEAQLAKLQASAGNAQAKATAAETAVASTKDQLLRLSADFENFRRRTREEKDKLADSVRGDIVTSLLPVVDNFELARTQVKPETAQEEKINTSYQGLYKQFVDFLRNLGVEAVPTVGAPFDPNFHEAIAKEVSEGSADGTVLEEFRKGFTLKNKLLRPAMVKISMDGSMETSVSEEASSATTGAEEEPAPAVEDAESKQ